MLGLIENIIPKSKRARNIIFLMADIVIIVLSCFLGLFIRFDFAIQNIPTRYAEDVIQFFPFYLVITLLIFKLFKMYSTMWSVAGLREAIYIFMACALAQLIQISGMVMLQLSVPRSYFVISFAALCALEFLWRFSYRMVRSLKANLGHPESNIRIMIVGAGEAGATLLREIRGSQYTHGRVLCFIDDSDYKVGKNLNGVSIVGNRDKITEAVDKYRINKIYIAMPSATAHERKDIIEICRKTSAEIKVLPGIYQLVNGEVSVSKLRDIQIEDLLGREPIRVNLDEVMGYIKDKVILVTGGGGSIGSELCRQIARHDPKLLIIFDIYENSVYDLQQELKHNYPDLNFIVLIGSVRNTHRINSIFEEYRPNVVFHAAAHKHVPLMEDSPNEAIKNNVFGTYKTAQAADRYGAERFVLISTDKAVNPTNIMGASKRICEMIIQMMARHSKTNFVAVRFGNVLGSNGSVIPLFKKQIEQGGPVTVTHPDIIRYFMTIPEAVSLVLQAGAYAKGGEIFVLDMGEPVKILDMAKNLIRLSGYEPDVDIKIEFTGLRPGEKLYEEMLMKEEGLRETPNKMIFIGKPIDFNEIGFMSKLKNLEDSANKDMRDIRKEVAEIVVTYKPEET